MAVTLVGPPAVARNINGRLELFALGDTLYHIWQTSPGGSWSNWLSHGRPPSGMLSGTPALAPSADGRLELFISGDDGNLYHIWQTSPSGTWSNWLSHGQPPSTSLVGIPVLARNADGRLELFVLGSALNDLCYLYHIWQTSPNGTWSNWDSLGQPSSSFRGGALALAPNVDGRLELFAIGSGTLYHIWQTSPGGSWSNWDSIGESSSIPPGVSTLTLATNADGRLELFSMQPAGGALSGNPNAYHIWQTSPGGSWSAWDSIGHP